MRRVAAALTVVIGIAVIALSGHGRNDGLAQAAVQRAAVKTAAAGSARFTISWNAPSLPTQMHEALEGEGSMDFVNRRGRISYGATSQAIYDGDTVYMSLPLPWRESAPWIRFEDGDEDPLDLYDRAMHNPIGLLEFVKGASNDTYVVGKELVRGTPTTLYQGTLDLQLVVDQAPPAKREELQQWLDLIGETAPTKVPFGLWVDSHGVTHRLRIDNGESDTLTIEYFDFGVAVEVTPPPADEIINSDQLWRELELNTEDADCSGDEHSDDDGHRLTATPRWTQALRRTTSEAAAAKSPPRRPKAQTSASA